MTKNALDLQMRTLVTFSLCIVTSEIRKYVDAETKIDLQILAETEMQELTTQLAVTGTGREISRT